MTYRYPSDEGALSNKEIMQLLHDSCMATCITSKGAEILMVRSLLYDAINRLAYLLKCDYTVAWDKWGDSKENLVIDQIAEVVDRMAQLLRYLFLEYSAARGHV
jgi:hypothetical protein